jgi:hypothetical protein
MNARIQHPSEEPLRLGALATVLEGARLLALRSWHPDRYDIYHCAQRAWRAQNIPVPYAAIIYQLRCLVDGGNLLAANDAPGRTRDDIADLYAAARDNVLRQHQLAQRHPSRVTTARPMVTIGLAATA